MTTLVLIAVCALLGLLAPVLLEQIEDKVQELASTGFCVDELINTTTNSTVTSSIANVFASIGISLLMLLFLVKGFQTYVLYTDGDAESDPINFLTLFVKGLVVAVCGNTILSWFADIVINLSDSALTAVENALGSDAVWQGLVDEFGVWTEDLIGDLLFGFIFVAIFAVLFWILYFKCLSNGIELWILKIALPICSIGLINSDKGIFKNYVMSVSKVMVTILVQITLTQLGFSILIAGDNNDNLFLGSVLGIACLITALRSPKMLGEFMIPSQGGGNLLMKAYYSSSMIRSVRGSFKRFFRK
ncbi:conjugal transfer protein TrbL family protein [Ruminococcus sp. Marseille-P6503]|uniref:conjugal transfer protein TrbL family protein n=1 Tax=Ruminococcus sp. Marseille-P6503 TaxID=2364796 RepID=UPI000F51C1B5|nr:conjugal transfer protein TrbL family protein [Ruminococcus sp. Marseille-P6503]